MSECNCKYQDGNGVGLFTFVLILLATMASCSNEDRLISIERKMDTIMESLAEHSTVRQTVDEVVKGGER